MSDKKEPAKKKGKKQIALRNFECQFGTTQVSISEGDNIAEMNLPEWVIVNLKTEKVLEG